jgi:hypothetical protein
MITLVIASTSSALLMSRSAAIVALQRAPFTRPAGLPDRPLAKVPSCLRPASTGEARPGGCCPSKEGERQASWALASRALPSLAALALLALLHQNIDLAAELQNLLRQARDLGPAFFRERAVSSAAITPAIPSKRPPEGTVSE